jgi:hypothetical protein
MDGQGIPSQCKFIAETVPTKTARYDGLAQKLWRRLSSAISPEQPSVGACHTQTLSSHFSTAGFTGASETRVCRGGASPHVG